MTMNSFSSIPVLKQYDFLNVHDDNEQFEQDVVERECRKECEEKRRNEWNSVANKNVANFF